MKHLVIMMAVFGAVSVARADGFVCSTSNDEAGALNVKVYDNTDPSEGTRNVAVMVISDPAISAGKKTIARFTDVNSTLNNKGSHYMAKVDLRFNDSSLKGRNIAGTKLGFIDTIALDIAFSYANPVPNGESVDGWLTVQKRNGEEKIIELSCQRYLKD